MTPEFARLVNPTIDNVLQLVERIDSGHQPKLEVERDKLVNILGDARSEAARRGRTSEFELAQRFLVYWADELLTVATADASEDRDQWKEVTLEWFYYHEKERAWKFYVEAEQSGRHAGSDVLELIYLMLVLGFKGEIDFAWDHIRRDHDRNAGEKVLRELWSKEIHEIIRSSASPGQTIPTLPPPEGDTAPPPGEGCLHAATALLGFALVLFLAALIWFLWRT